jgi:hypothetical protein
MKILYLCNKDYYLKKMSRVRFHGMRAVGQLCDLTWSGPNWENWDNDKTATENVAQLYEDKTPDLVVAYKPLEIKGYAELDALKCIRYNEMYDVQWTMKEIMQSKSNIVVCHHKNDMEQYQKLLQNFKLFPVHLVNVPHCAEKTVFKDYELPKTHDLLLAGAANGFTLLGRHYPLRDRMLEIAQKMSSKYKVYTHPHPGYDLSDAHTDKYLIEFAKVINSSKIAITCSGAPNSRFGKYVEIPMCATAIAADLPGEEQKEFSKFLIDINMSMTDEEIIKKLEFYLENDEERSKLVKKGLEYAENYTQEDYAERFMNVVGKN